MPCGICWIRCLHERWADRLHGALLISHERRHRRSQFAPAGYVCRALDVQRAVIEAVRPGVEVRDLVGRYLDEMARAGLTPPEDHLGHGASGEDGLRVAAVTAGLIESVQTGRTVALHYPGLSEGDGAGDHCR